MHPRSVKILLKEEIESRVGFEPYTTIRLATSGRDENFRSNAQRRQRRQRPALVDAEFQSTGPRRVCDEEPPEVDVCDISRRSTANSRTDSKPALPRELGGQRSIKLLRG
ncbi:large subunit ribosomal protein L37e [Blastomyces parvus]|uniref:Large subunit ribosomal protein L37e n=1 Tax=Blastomyces parvus TaxID=2060905 RepID=A0A2B7X6Y0_9EURO|nr:large subunit ribosomal protein L37e [Blastomyces parvus]